MFLSRTTIVLLMIFPIPALGSSDFAQDGEKIRNSTRAMKEPQAVDWVTGIFKLFDSRPLVALDEGGHHMAQSHAFFALWFKNRNLRERLAILSLSSGLVNTRM